MMKRKTLTFLFAGLLILTRCDNTQNNKSNLPGQTINDPAFLSVSIDQKSLYLGYNATYTITSEVKYAGSNIVIYRWRVNDQLESLEVNPTFEVSFTPADDAEYSVKVMATDGSYSAEDSVSIKVYDQYPEAGHVDIGTISGDSGSDTITYNSRGDALLRIFVNESYSGTDPKDLIAAFQLEPDTSDDYDIVVFSDSACLNEIDRSDTEGSGNEKLNITIIDTKNCVLGTCVTDGTDNSQYLYAWIKCIKDNGKGNWTLTVFGNAPL